MSLTASVPRGLPACIAPQLHCVTHSVYLMTTLFQFLICQNQAFGLFFFPSFFARHQSEPTRRSSVHVAPRGALSGDKSSFLLLKPGKHPAENPFALRCTVVEQRVLTGCTAVFSHPCVECQPQRNSNSGQK